MRPRVLSFIHAVEFLQHILDSTSSPTILLICHARTYFLDQIYESVTAETEHDDDQAAIDVIEEDETATLTNHALLSRSLHTIAHSKRVQLVFCPRVDILRAFLSGRLAAMASSRSDTSILAVLDLVALHHETTEFSVQGLSRTLALLVETAAGNGLEVLLNECKDVHDLENIHRGPRLWEAQVPLLSGSVKLSGEGNRWAGRVISVKRVAGRWFIFERVQSTVELDVQYNHQIL